MNQNHCVHIHKNGTVSNQLDKTKRKNDGLSKYTMSHVVCVSNDGGIARDNKRLWTLPDDLEYFHKIIFGKPVIMGRKTFEEMGKIVYEKLKTFNIVLSSALTHSTKTYSVADSLSHAIKLAKQACKDQIYPEIMILGGESIYNETWALINRAYINMVLDPNPPKADRFYIPFQKDAIDFSSFKNYPVPHIEKGENPAILYGIVDL